MTLMTVDLIMMILEIDLNDLFDPTDDDRNSGWSHTYNSCNNDDHNPQNAYYNGCTRCVMIACEIASVALGSCEVIFKE